ncbi:MAG: hypothetical protein M3R67_11035, partial [Acidobacteriota bacterium]|nr:hypothetical protein [Acidobacteriota bacterium]
MSSPKTKAKSSVNRQVKSALGAVRDFLAGRSGDAKVANSADKDLRQVVAAELLAAMSGRETEEIGRSNTEGVSTGASAPKAARATKKVNRDDPEKMSASGAEAPAVPDTE